MATLNCLNHLVPAGLVIPQENLILYLDAMDPQSLDPKNLAEWRDLSPQGHIATLNDVEVVLDASTNVEAVRLKGLETSYVSIPNLAGLVSHSFTVVLYYKSSATGEQPLVAFGNDVGTQFNWTTTTVTEGGVATFQALEPLSAEAQSQVAFRRSLDTRLLSTQVLDNQKAVQSTNNITYTTGNFTVGKDPLFNTSNGAPTFLAADVAAVLVFNSSLGIDDLAELNRQFRTFRAELPAIDVPPGKTLALYAICRGLFAYQAFTIREWRCIHGGRRNDSCGHARVRS